MSLQPVTEATKSSVAFAPIEWEGITDDILVGIWLRSTPSEGKALAKTCRRFYTLLFINPMGNLAWTSFVAQSFPHLGAKNVKLPGQVLYKKAIELWHSCKRQNLMMGSHSTQVKKFDLPHNTMIESAIVGENNDLLLCSKNPFQILRYDFKSGACQYKDPLSELSFQRIACTDGCGHFFSVEEGAIECVKLSNIETCTVLKEFSVGAENLNIKRLCATDRFVVALTERKEDRVGFVLIWDRNQPEGCNLPKHQLEMGLIIEIQVQDNLLYLLSEASDFLELYDFCDLSIFDLNQNQFIEKHRLKYQDHKTTNLDPLKIQSFAVEDRILSLHCYDGQLHRFRTLALNGPGNEYSDHYNEFFPTSNFAHMQKGSNSWAIFPTEGHLVEFWDFSPHPGRFASAIDDEFPLLLISFGLTTKEQYSQYFELWPTGFAAMGILSSQDVAKVLEWAPERVAHVEMLQVSIQNPKDLKDLRAEALQKKEHLLTCLQTLQSIAAMNQQQWIDRWSIKRPSLTANPWSPILEKIHFFCENLNSRCQSDKKLLATFEAESYSEIVLQMNNLIDEFNSAGAVNTLQNYLCEPSLSNIWSGLQISYGVSSLHALSESSPDLFKKYFDVFSRINKFFST
jgi:hypothetical protein